VPRSECVQASATTPSPSETQAPRNEPIQVTSETQVPCTECVQASAMTPSPPETQAPRNKQVQVTSAILSSSKTQLEAPHNDQVQHTVAVPSATVKKSVKMRPGSLNTSRQAFIPFSIFPLKLSPNLRGVCSIDWCRKNPRGTAAEFKVFYDNLHPTELQVREQYFFCFYIYLIPHLIRGTRISRR
jgi:hypothetical protein